MTVDSGRPVQAVMIDSLVGNDYAYCLCRGLDEIGQDVTLVTLAGRREPFECHFEIRDWAPPKSNDGRLRKGIDYLTYLRRTFQLVTGGRNRAETVLHVQFLRRPVPEAMLVAAVARLGVKVVLTAHNVNPHEGERAHAFALQTLRRSATAVIAHTEGLRDALVATGDVTAEQVAVIPHGNFDYYRELADPTAPDLRDELGIGSDAIVVLVFGSIRDYKGVDRFIDAFAGAAEQNSSLHLVVAGSPLNDAMSRSLHQQVDSSGVSDRITLHDRFIPTERVAAYLDAADLVALPYRMIYHSGVLHLAYSFAKPVFVTDVGDFAEVVNDHRTGFVTDNADADVLAAALLEATADRDELAAMGRRALTISENEYSWTAIGRRTSELYRAIVTSDVVPATV